MRQGVGTALESGQGEITWKRTTEKNAAMQNDRLPESPYMARCRSEIIALLERYDLAGAVCLVNEEEWSYAYQLPATWNAIVDDPTVPLGFRVRAKSAELGHDRAHALILGAAHTTCSLKDFGHQTQRWMSDLLRMLRQAGVQITHRPFNGQKLPRLTHQPPR